MQQQAIDQQSIIEKNITLYVFANVCMYRYRTNRKVNEWKEQRKKTKKNRHQGYQ